MCQARLGEFLVVLMESKYLQTIQLRWRNEKLVGVACHFEAFDRIQGIKVSKPKQHLKIVVSFSQLNDVLSVRDFAKDLIHRASVIFDY